jgi:hypothetical protein
MPLTSQNKKGSWYVGITFKGENNTANLAQVRIFSSYRMYELMGLLDKDDVKRIKNGFLRLYS